MVGRKGIGIPAKSTDTQVIGFPPALPGWQGAREGLPGTRGGCEAPEIPEDNHGKNTEGAKR